MSRSRKVPAELPVEPMTDPSAPVHCGRRRFQIGAFAAMAGALTPALPAFAQSTWPSQPVKLVAPFPPGGGADVIARIFSAKLAELLGQPVVVENRPGAGTLLAAGQVAKAPADGYTLIVATADTLAVATALYGNPPAWPEKELAPISQVVRTPLFIVVRPDSPFKTLADFIEAVRKEPNKITYGSAGIGTIHHLAMEMLAQQANIQPRHIAYKGSTLAVTDLLGGHIDVVSLDSPTTLAQLKGDKIRALSISTPQRISLAPNVPTIAEQGYAGYEAMTWMGFAAPLGTPQPIIDRLFAALKTASEMPDVRARLLDMGLDPINSASPTAFAEYATRERARWHKLIRDAKIEPVN